MNQTVRNVIESFRLCKNDIIKLQNEIAELGQGQERVMERVDDLRKKLAAISEKVSKMAARKIVVKKAAAKPKKKAKKAVKRKVIVKKVVHRAKKIYVASKTGKDVHERNCPFAKNIKPKSKVYFHSKAKALNQGYRLCECLKK